MIKLKNLKGRRKGRVKKITNYINEKSRKI